MFRRKRTADDPGDPVDETVGGSVSGEDAGPRADGPWDADEVDLEEAAGSRMDLGGLLIAPQQGLDVQLQVDEASGQVIAVVLAGQEGAVELRPFAAPRNKDIWGDVRRQVSAEVARMGGTATEVEGPYGTALRVSLGVKRPDGSTGTQVSQVLGIAGPRWLLRATMFGRPAVEYRPDGDVETALRNVVVVRGKGPIPPGDPLPLTVPPNAQRLGE